MRDSQVNSWREIGSGEGTQFCHSACMHVCVIDGFCPVIRVRLDLKAVFCVKRPDSSYLCCGQKMFVCMKNVTAAPRLSVYFRAWRSIRDPLYLFFSPIVCSRLSIWLGFCRWRTGDTGTIFHGLDRPQDLACLPAILQNIVSDLGPQFHGSSLRSGKLSARLWV